MQSSLGARELSSRNFSFDNHLYMERLTEQRFWLSLHGPYNEGIFLENILVEPNFKQLNQQKFCQK